MLRKELKGKCGSSVQGDSVCRRGSVQIPAEVIVSGAYVWKLLGLCLRPGLALTLLVLRGCLPAAVHPSPRVSGAPCFSMAAGVMMYVSVSCLGVSTVLSLSFGVGSLALAFYELGLHPNTPTHGA